VLPEQDAVVAIHSETRDMQGLMNLAWEHLLPAFGSGKLPASKAQASALKQYLGSHSLPLLAAAAPGPLEEGLAGKTFHFPPSEARIEALRFAFDKKSCRVALSYRGQEFPLTFGRGGMGLRAQRPPRPQPAPMCAGALRGPAASPGCRMLPLGCPR
jgi:hypothetical protein